MGGYRLIGSLGLVLPVLILTNRSWGNMTGYCMRIGFKVDWMVMFRTALKDLDWTRLVTPTFITLRPAPITVLP